MIWFAKKNPSSAEVANHFFMLPTLSLPVENYEGNVLLGDEGVEPDPASSAGRAHRKRTYSIRSLDLF
jgi:hypothetical protein